MTELRKGDTVRHSSWTHLSDMKVEAVSGDGSHLWLMDNEGELRTRKNTEQWEKVEPFFVYNKNYKGNVTGETFQVNHLSEDRKGQKYAILENVRDSQVRIVRPTDFKYYTEVEL